ncbi:MAG: sulfatase, partial [Verrucomicrobiota bacterium]
RSLWALHVTKLLSEESLLELLSHEDEYVRAFTIQFLCEDRTAPESALKQFAELATNDPSPVVRLYLAAALQRLDYDQRWPILANLSQHKEDAEDNNIPRMLWFALEPMVPLHPERSLELAVGSQLTNLQEHVSRRLVSGDLPPVSQRNHQRPGLAPPAAQKDIQRVAPGFQVKNVGEQGVSPQPEFRNDFAVQTHPLSRNMPCVLFRELDVPEGKATRLRIRASYHPHGNWQLRVLANKKVIHDQIVSYETVKTEWLELDLDLSEFAGQQVNLEVENRANDWSWEFAFWGKVEIVHPTTTASTEALPSPSPTPGQRPNILFCISDDQSYAHTGANGDPVVKTPGFDRIAKEGLRFVHAFCDAPTCGPSRSAILTGQPIWRLEEAGNIHSTLPAKFATYTELLADAGYATGYTGKAWSPGRLEAGGRSQNPAGPEFSSKTLTPPFKAIRNTDYAGNFADFLDQVPEDAPFCFWLGTSEPHRGYEKGAGELTGKDPDKVIVPPFFPDNEIVRSDFLDYFVEIEHSDSAVLRAIEMLEESGQLDNTIVVVTSDHGMPFPRAKASLYDAGTRVPLAIRWPGGITNPGRVVEGFVNLSDLAPTFLEAAGLEPPEMMTARSLLDLFEDQPNKDRDAAYIAMERHDGCRKGGKGYPCRAIRTEDYLYIHNFEPTRWPSGSPDASVCARAIPYGEIDTAPTKTFLMQNRDQHGVAKLAELAFGMRPAEELYDLKNDPHQMVNLAGSVEAAEIQATMRKRLFDHLEETADPRVVGGTVDWDYYPYYGRMKNEDWKVDPKP